MKRIMILVLCLFAFNGYAATDVVIFSNNNPVQLRALVVTVTANTDDLGSVYVIYDSDTDQEMAYIETARDLSTHSLVPFFACRMAERSDFKQLVVDHLSFLQGERVSFVFDTVADMSPRLDLVVDTVMATQLVSSQEFDSLHSLESRWEAMCSHESISGAVL